MRGGFALIRRGKTRSLRSDCPGGRHLYAYRFLATGDTAHVFPSQLGGKEVAGKCGQEALCGFHDEECSGRAEQGGAAESE